MSLNYYAPRSCYEAVDDKTGRARTEEKPLASYRDCPAYVLLGKPGSGKTTAFKEEAKRPGCEYVTARDFITFEIRPEWRDKTLFIDGLDEVRAGRVDTLTPFDNIRSKLDRLERPRFRLSCREADWYGVGDREQLAQVSPGHDLKELFLAGLTKADLRQVLLENYHKTGAAASSFLEEAECRELADLIKNPQLLDMLVTAVAGGAWPETKSDTFKLACEKLLPAEWNRSHNDVNRTQIYGTEQLMQAAGLLCALLLLTQKYGFALSPADADEDYPFIGDVDSDQADLLPFAAKTKLFTTRDGRTEYSHRIFAEYLSACCLSDKILNKGLPTGRVLALMTGGDGGVVTGLRGVYAWLATLCHRQRPGLIRRDPLGVVLYGDVSLFDKEERLRLLEALRVHVEATKEPGLDYRNERSFGPFCQADMEQEFRAILESTERGTTQQCLLAYVLASMFHGEQLPGLSDAVAGLLQNPGCWPGNRGRALDLLIRFDDEQVLRKILTGIDSNDIIDPDDELLGTLIGSLYPEQVTPAEILNYLHPPKSSNYSGAYLDFWTDALVARSDAGQVAQLLDELVEKQGTLGRDLEEFSYRTMVGRLMARGLELFGDTMEMEKLSGWMDLGLDEYGSLSLGDSVEENEENSVIAWFKQHPEIQMRLFEYYLDNCGNSGDVNWRLCNIEQWLFDGTGLPDDYGRWCLHKAGTSDNEEVAKHLFTESVRTLEMETGNAGMSLELIENKVAEDARLEPCWEGLRSRNIPGHRQPGLERVKQREREKQEFIRFIRNNLADIKAGTATPGIFSQLGSVYYGYFIYSTGDTPLERLNNFFGNDSDLVQSVLKGIRRFPYREDIPGVMEIFRLIPRGGDNFRSVSLYSSPYRAAMEVPGTDILQLSEDKIEKALAFYFADGSGVEPAWYKVLLQQRPDLVAEIYIMYGMATLRAGNACRAVHSLAHDKNHAGVACRAALPLLESIRVRGTSRQLTSLAYLLKAAIRHADPDPLRELIEKKLLLKSMNTAQRVHWLAAGFILEPGQFTDRLVEFVSANESRVNYLGGFLLPRDNQWSPLDSLPPSTLAPLIRLFGLYYTPYSPLDSSDSDFSAFNTSTLTSKLIGRLATFPTDEATAALETLLEADELTKWHPVLTRSLHEQRRGKREAMFQRPGLEQVCSTLKNAAPANVADLAALTRERIRELSHWIKNGNTNDYRQYWIRGRNGRTRGRRHEEDCRDMFLSDLRQRLADLAIQAEPEGRYANAKRADIKVSYGGANGFQVPIEVKCNDSQDLWHAMRRQLIERYAQDPGADGYGIYLVFWFGRACTTPPGENSPKTPAELEKCLRRLLTHEEERKKISVCIVDCTGP